MTVAPRRISVEEWDERRLLLLRSGLREPEYGGPLSRHVRDGDLRLRRLVFEVRCRSVLGRGRKRDMRRLPLKNGIGGRPVRVPTVQPRL